MCVFVCVCDYFNLQKILFADSAVLWNKNMSICTAYVYVCKYMCVLHKCIHFYIWNHKYEQFRNLVMTELYFLKSDSWELRECTKNCTCSKNN